MSRRRGDTRQYNYDVVPRTRLERRGRLFFPDSKATLLVVVLAAAAASLYVWVSVIVIGEQRLLF